MEELQGHELPPKEIAVQNARLKCLDILWTHPADVILAADTVVILDQKLYGKPADMEEATAMLKALSGRIHEVVTAVCIGIHGARRSEFFETTRVKFRKLSPESIPAYLQRINPLDKAGAYAAQDDNGEIIEQTEGSLSNVIGLPLRQVKETLDRHFNIRPNRKAHIDIF